MKTTGLLSLPIVGMCVLAMWLSTNSFANNQGFPLLDKRAEHIAQQPLRYFVKYQKGKESEVIALLRKHDIEVVDVLVDQHVLVVIGEQAEISTLIDNNAIEYTEQEPIRTLLSK
ncbi:ATPase [Vibrio sp. D420a]|uniref:ATPase n=1 Tax=Vibrio sp. D420a TaxID=2836895 RepID=UPI002555EF4B|nr:ATPase [Vibrio sp. D420a]MDK9764695.1 ATPase [Vibrio sp. D420a]